MDLISQIEGYIHEADTLSSMIEKSNFMIERLDGRPDLQKPYIDELREIVSEYLSTIKALSFLFKEYFEWERKIKKTRNLRYRRLNKLILEDLAKPVPPKLK